jgi:LacI family transcriptional regulator
LNIKELAKIAGVSPATVSLVLNNKKGVGEETRRHVNAVLEEYNYVIPKRTKSTPKNILFIKYIEQDLMIEENLEFTATVMDSIENDCRNFGYSLSILTSENCLEETLQSIDFTLYQGLILLGTELDFHTYPLLDKIPIPYIVIDNKMPHRECNCVALNNNEMVYKALSHLASLGHKTIAYFRSNKITPNSEERNNCFLAACEKCNLTYEPVNELLLTPTLLGAYQSMKEYLEHSISLPSCAFADSDAIAIGAIKALKEYNYKIPDDISIIGFDDIPFSAINSPTLTTIAVPKKLIGSMALRQLHTTIEDPTFQNIKIFVGGTIVVRESTKEWSGINNYEKID